MLTRCTRGLSQIRDRVSGQARLESDHRHGRAGAPGLDRAVWDYRQPRQSLVLRARTPTSGFCRRSIPPSCYAGPASSRSSSPICSWPNNCWAKRSTRSSVSYEGLETLDQVSAFFERIRDVPEVVVDLETTGLDWEIEQVRCIGINYGRGNNDNAVIAVDFFRRDGTEERLKPLVRAWLESRRHRFIGQNRKFDMSFPAAVVRRRGPDHGLGRHLRHGLFAQRGHHAGSRPRSPGRFIVAWKPTTKRNSATGSSQAQEAGRLLEGGVERGAELYCAADVWVTRRVRDALLDCLRLQPALLDLYYGHYLALQSAIIEAERVGFYIDQGRARQVNARLSAACDRRPRSCGTSADDPQFNVALAAAGGRALDQRSGAGDVWATSCSDRSPTLLEDALEYRGVEKLRGTYCQGILIRCRTTRGSGPTGTSSAP